MEVAGDGTSPAGTRQAELMRRFTEFLDADNGRGPLSRRIKDMVRAPDAETLARHETPKRLIVSIDDLRDFDPELASDVITEACGVSPHFRKDHA